MYKVLLVDDEYSILEGLRCLIDWKKYGLEIAGDASDGQQAIEILKNTEIQILITDIKMPNKDGLELIRYIRDQKLKIKCIVLSGYDDFSLVKEAARLGIENYILKPVDENELIQTLSSTVEKFENEAYQTLKLEKGLRLLKDNILNRWIMGNISDMELDDKFSFMDNDFLSPFYAVSIIKVFNHSSLPTDIPDAVKHSLYEQIRFHSDRFIRSEVFFDQNENIVVIFFLPTDDKEENKLKMHNFLSKCIESCGEFQKMQLFSSTGSIVNKSVYLCDSYMQANELLLYGLIYTKRKVVFYDDKGDSASENEKYIRSAMTELEQSILTKDVRQTEHLVDRLFMLLEIQKPEVQSLREIIAAILYKIIRATEYPATNINSLYDFYHKSFINFDLLSSIDQFKAVIAEVISKRIEPAAIQSQHRITQKMLDYIHARYFENINLNTVSEELSMNPVYLGCLFKKDTGMRFTDYHNKHRIEKVIEMLSTTNLRTSEIMEKAGFVNTSYFYTVFKKITGLTIAEYKENLKKLSKTI